MNNTVVEIVDTLENNLVITSISFDTEKEADEFAISFNTKDDRLKAFIVVFANY